MIFGRRSVPGDSSLQQQLNPNRPHERILRTQVSTVDSANGVAIVNYDGLPSGGRYVTVPPLWMSFPPDTAGAGPAWGRYMPQPTDLLKIGFGHDNTPFAIGYDALAYRDDVADGYSGWPELNRLYAEAATNASVADNKKKFGQFIPLQPGEYDFMSSGGAYIYGDNRGRLYLAGGSVSVSLVKNEMRLNTNAQLWSHTSESSELRFGQVRRVSDQTTGLESALSDKSLRELKLTLKQSSRKLVDLAVGNVINDSGAVIDSTFSQASLLRLATYNDASSKLLELNIDSVGNIDISSPTADGGVYLDFSAGKWISKNTEVEWNASSKFSVVSPIVNLGSTSPSEQLVLGSTYIPAQMSWATSVNTNILQLAATGSTHAGATTALASILAAAAVPMAIPIVGPSVAAVIIGAGMASLIASTLPPILTQYTGVVTSITPAHASFTSAAVQRYLSNVSRTL